MMCRNLQILNNNKHSKTIIQKASVKSLPSLFHSLFKRFALLKMISMEINKIYSISFICSNIFLISMKIIFKSANLYLMRYEVTLLILKTTHGVV